MTSPNDTTRMALPRGRWWASLVASDIFLVIGMGLYAGKAFDPFFDGIVMLLVGGLIFSISVFATGITTYLWKPARRYFLTVNFCVLLLLLLAYAGHLYERGLFRVGFDQAQSYMAVARPALDEYKSDHGHYPDSLQRVDLNLRPPSGMTYVRNFDPTHPLDEGYSVTFSDAIYCPDGKWFIDD